MRRGPNVVRPQPTAALPDLRARAATRLAPAVAFVGFLVATVVHWGQGDIDFLERFLGRRRAGLGGHAASVALRGALPIAVPVLVQTGVAD